VGLLFSQPGINIFNLELQVFTSAIPVIKQVIGFDTHDLIVGRRKKKATGFVLLPWPLFMN
jgi:hypothetical protein